MEVRDRCSLCGGVCSAKGSYVVLGKYDAAIASCDLCGFTFAINPIWLSDAYFSPMTSVDIGQLDRCVTYSAATKVLIEVFHNRRGRFLDFGGGYGLFVRRMRDLGYDFVWYDKKCPNLFAKGFEGVLKSSQRYEIITAFEVMEHMLNPGSDLEQILQSSKSFLFSTELLPKEFPGFGEWPYFGPEHGQHISFYSATSLKRFAAAHGKKFVTDGNSLHMITEQPISNSLFRVITNRTCASLLAQLRRRDTLLYSDFQRLRSDALKITDQRASTLIE